MALPNDSEERSSDDTEKKPSDTSQAFWTPGRVLLSVVALGLIIAFVWSKWNSKNLPANNRPPANRVANVPPPVNNAPTAAVDVPQDLRDAKVQTLDGESLKLSDFADKVLVVNIWAVWCGPCRLEMPELIKISNEYKSRGLVVVGLASSYREDQAQVKEFV